jgi:hypothetical protein
MTPTRPPVYARYTLASAWNVPSTIEVAISRIFFPLHRRAQPCTRTTRLSESRMARCRPHSDTCAARQRAG